MKRFIKIILVLVLIIGICNIPIISITIGSIVGTDTFFGNNIYEFESDKGGFKFTLHGELSRYLQEFEEYKKKYPNDTILYRKFKRNPFLFWRWYHYTTHEIYQYPFKKE